MSAQSWRFQAEPGLFADLPKLATQYPDGKLTTQPGLALVDREYPTDGEVADDKRPWTRFAAYVRSLNRASPDNVSYKVLYLTRHGFGYHNKKHAEVGTEAWDTKWSFMNGDEHSTWFDSFLTETGIQQAKDLDAFWVNAVEKDGVPLPQTIYTSPLARCLQTTKYAFGPLMERHGKPLQPIIKEKIRERFTLHTCDLRRPRSWITENWPGYTLESGFPEEDPFASLTVMETDEEHRARKHAALEDIYSTDANEFIELTVHSYAINAILDACNAPQFPIREGSSIALLVKGEKTS